MYLNTIESCRNAPVVISLLPEYNTAYSLSRKGFNPDEYQIIGEIKSHKTKKTISDKI